jgi:methyl-accepting chemotaxis protein
LNAGFRLYQAIPLLSTCVGKIVTDADTQVEQVITVSEAIDDVGALTEDFSASADQTADTTDNELEAVEHMRTEMDE